MSRLEFLSYGFLAGAIILAISYAYTHNKLFVWAAIGYVFMVLVCAIINATIKDWKDK